MSTSTTDLAATYEALMRTYFDRCNEADVEKLAACFTEDAVHYFPPSMYGGAWRGGRTIAERWAHFVATKGSAWTVDRIVVEPESHQAVMEWTHYKTAEGTILRGDEWYVFDEETGLIKEIRAYYAAAQHPGVKVTELEDFDYAGRGYHLECPVPRPTPTENIPMNASSSNLAATYEALMRTYFDRCNEADVEKLAACFTEDAVHYFPPSMYGGAWRGGRTIAERWAHFVATKGSAWTVDRIVVEPDSHQAVMEWTHYKTAEGTILRGSEWYVFDEETGLISEIRAYYAAAQHPGVKVTELEDFDYAGRGYHLECPVPRPASQSANA